ncbi:uncharacterized protein PFL1_02562 [Pseudozyma flocculosa PF-1]|uniref:Uncharacterized protein n=1 Tax=Pseudozyma flocculosa PF-1 TaxID=1277687 RepID=A0A061HBN6_9BASI|nr:uncharacterized protein PFL1_02562 [Pseudozyma flocculosa PF-1]EPQ29889.1 hypothetical protein PFL1_02562 [Pseudozyma flocculosa PF-1]
MNGAAASPQHAGAGPSQRRDLERQPTWAKFDFGGDFDLDQSTPASERPGDAGPSRTKQARAPLSTSKALQGQGSARMGDFAGADPMIAHPEALAQGGFDPRLTAASGAASAAPAAPAAAGQSDWNRTPRLQSEFANGLSRQSPDQRAAAERPQFTPSNGQRPFAAGAISASPVSTPRDQHRAQMAAAASSSPSYASAGFDSAVNTTPKATGTNSFIPQQQQQRQQHRAATHEPAFVERQEQRPPLHRPISSADAYNQPDPVLASLAAAGSGGGSRPGTALSQMSGEGWMSEGAGNRSSYSTNYSATGKEARRASVLSFQTAMSGGGLDGFASGDEARTSSRGGDDNFEEATEALAARPVPGTKSGRALRESIQPWLQNSNFSGYGSSPDERTLPGALPPGAWGEPSYRNSTSSPASRTVPLYSSYRQSPKTASSALPPLPQEEPAFQPVPPPVPAKATASLPATSPKLPPLQMPDLLSIPRSSAAAGPPSSTIGPSSDAGQTVGPPSANEAVSTAAARSGIAWADASGSMPSAGASGRDAGVETASTVDGPLSDNVIPPPLPSEVAEAAHRPGESPVTPVAPVAQKPVSDFRRKPLANLGPEEPAASPAHLQSLSEPGRAGVVGTAGDAGQRASESGTAATAAKGLEADGENAGAAAPISTPADGSAVPADRQRRPSSASLLPTAALAQPPQPTAASAALLERSASPSIEGPSREPSPPPDGEVEARAEWERTQMKRKQKREESAAKTSRTSGTLRSQLRPLQLVPAESVLGPVEDARTPVSAHVQDPAACTSPSSARRPSGAALDGVSGTKDGGNANNSSTNPNRQSNASDAVVSTQQLQRNQAREQRRSVGAFSASMAAANAVSGGSNGPYPVFTSPTVASKKGARQYPGIMPQRSLVPPFELQNRPDGLPSGLIGPDGVRRSINDPEVCLECMMRDEDMIDVQVVGEGIWERESDKDFLEAVRFEAEEASRQHQRAATEEGEGGSVHEHSSNHGSSSQRHTLSSSERAQSRNATLPPRPRHKKIGKGEPLTSERLKLHTQMNPPASSHRWRTLQTFLAVQAKYIAMEHERLRHEAERRRSTAIAPGATTAGAGGRGSPDPGRQSPVPAGTPGRDAASSLRNRSSSGSLLKNAIVMDDDGLSPAEREEKLRDIASARAARSRAAGLGAPHPVASTPPALPSVPPVPRPVSSLQQPPVPAAASDVVPASSGCLPQLGTPVRTGAAAGKRTSSAHELRPPSGALSSPVPYPPSPAESLAPPSRPFVPTSPSASSRLASRSGASQLSLMHSGSMIDMHVALEDRNEHRLNQAGFIPGTPIAMESPGAMSRAFYGFPGDGEVPAPDMAAEQARIVPGEGYVDPERARPEGMRSSPARDESIKRKKKGFRGFISKLTGSGGGGSTGNGSSHTAGASGAGSVNGSVASRNASKRSRSSSSPRAASASLPYDPTVDPVPTQINGGGGLISKARKSMSLFTDPTQAQSADDEALLRSRSQTQLQSLPAPFQNPPGMASQSSLDLGPFQQQPTNAMPIDPRASRSGVGAKDSARSFSSSRSLTNMGSPRDPSTPWTIPENGVEDRADQRSLSSVGRSSLRKELPPMPSAEGEDQMGQPMPMVSQHSRSGSNGVAGPIPAGRQSMSGSYGNRMPSAPVGRTSGAWQLSNDSGRRSMQVGRPPIPFTSPSPAQQNRFGNTSPEGSLAGSSLNDGPKRPPKNPRRPDNMTASPSFSGSTDSEPDRSGRPGPNSFGQAMETDFPSGSAYDALPKHLSAIDLNDARAGQQQQQQQHQDEGDKGNRKSKMLRLPFGRKKRESSVGAPSPSVFVGGGIENQPEAAPRKSNLGLGPPPMLRNRQSYSGLAPPKTSMHMERQRVLSSPSDGRIDMPPRSHSAFGMLSTQRFASASEARLSRDGRDNRWNGDDDDDDDDEGDDGIGFDRDYRAGPYGSGALTVPRGDDGGGRRNSTSGGAGGFGRKSLNLLREGFRMPSSSKLANGPEMPSAQQQAQAPSPQQPSPSPRQQQRKKRFGF